MRYMSVDKCVYWVNKVLGWTCLMLTASTDVRSVLQIRASKEQNPQPSVSRVATQQQYTRF